VLVIDQFEELFRYAAATINATPSGDSVRARDEATQFVQLLLEASRAPALKIHLMLTMRSDFIGDCARFHGLPEAVCAAQFLVPSLTRDQLDEVIRKPVEKAGATIDPELVERLLNDCSTELDQLPVLQHCLSRLWEEAGKAQQPAAATVAPTPTNQPSDLRAATMRHLTLAHYRAIGQFADALSLHADAILKDLPGPHLELAVKQVFSALSELDKEGRAIRRALKFFRLVAETGVDEKAVRQVLDRFRADDCSFLTPPIFEVDHIGADTRIDVGHEALLRRWEKVSGHGAELGWLRAEQQAGERYRGLLAMAEGDNAALPAHLVDERLAWWNARPRTAAWAERYGGGFDRVQRLLRVSKFRQRAKKIAIIATFVLVVGIAGEMYSLWQEALKAEVTAQSANNQALTAQAKAEQAQIQALDATKTSVGRLAGFLNDGAMSAKTAERLLDDARATLDDLAKSEDHPLEVSQIEILLLLNISDVRVALGKHEDVLNHAERAIALTERLLKAYPTDAKLKHHLYAGQFRIGDEMAYRNNIKEAEYYYGQALDTARQAAISDPATPQRQRDIAFVLNKLGDIYKIKKDWKAALDCYNEGLAIAMAMADQFPGDVATQKSRIAQLLSQRGETSDQAEALAKYREALVIQQNLLDSDPDNASITSNIATTHRYLGGMLQDQPALARAEYEAAVKYRKKLYDGDPGNVPWRRGLALDLTLLGDALVKQDDPRAAAQNYSNAVRIYEGFNLTDPSNINLLRNFAVLNRKRGDLLVDRANDAADPSKPVVDESTRLVGEALARYQVAAEAFERLTRDRDAATAAYSTLFDVKTKIGDIYVRQHRFKDAADAYDAASKVVAHVAATRPVADWQIRLGAKLEQTGDLLANITTDDVSDYQLAGTIAEDAMAFYQKAIDAIEAAATSQPDNQELQSKKTGLVAKITNHPSGTR
jgi:tetratricopeptide (TPR) repeat protein